MKRIGQKSKGSQGKDVDGTGHIPATTSNTRRHQWRHCSLGSSANEWTGQHIKKRKPSSPLSSLTAGTESCGRSVRVHQSHGHATGLARTNPDGNNGRRTWNRTQRGRGQHMRQLAQLRPMAGSLWRWQPSTCLFVGSFPAGPSIGDGEFWSSIGFDCVNWVQVASNEMAGGQSVIGRIYWRHVCIDRGVGWGGGGNHKIQFV